MHTRATLLALAATFAAGTAAAQGGRVNLRLAQNQPAKYTPPLCPLRAINAKVEKGIDLLKKAHDPKADRPATLAEAKRTLFSAITQEAQATNGAAWYYLGRVALLEGDPAGADSAFTKAQELAPSCEIDITQYRQNNWAMLANAAIDFSKKGEMDSALALFRDASLLFRGLPHVYQNMGIVFANTGHNDSAAAYFSKALALAEKDTAMVEDRNAAALNVALMLQRDGKHREAIQALHRYLGWKPGDMDAQKALSGSFRAAGMADSADALDISMVNEFSKQNLDSLDTSDLMAVGVAAFNGGRYPDAATVFSKALSRNQWSRDARYNLVNAYFAQSKPVHDAANDLRKAKLADSALKVEARVARTDSMLVAEAAKLTVNEPLSADALRLMAQGLRFQKKDDEVLKAAERLIAMPFSVDITGFQMGAASSRLTAVATGRLPTDAGGKPLAVVPTTLVVEFLSLTGQVLDTKEVLVQPLLVVHAGMTADSVEMALGKPQKVTPPPTAAGEAQWAYPNDVIVSIDRTKKVSMMRAASDQVDQLPLRKEFVIEAKAPGIVGWRYRVK